MPRALYNQRFSQKPEHTFKLHVDFLFFGHKARYENNGEIIVLSFRASCECTIYKQNTDVAKFMLFQLDPGNY